MVAARLRLGLLSVALAITVAACDHGEGDDVNPSAGHGALVVENNSASDFDFYVDGSYANKVEAGDVDSTELEPGVVRVFLRQRNGDHEGFGDDVDILSGRRSVVRISGGWSSFHISVNYD